MLNFSEEIKEAHVYARVSSEDQQERETIENQIDFALRYCDLHKITIVDWYKDDGISGKIPLEQRPDGSRLVEDAKSGKIKLVLIFNIKRLGRTARDILNSVYQLEQYGVKIRSMTEPFDTGTSHGRFVLTILAGVAELDRETTLENLWLGANRAARKGKWLGGIVPYGYRLNNEGYLEINQDKLPGLDKSEAEVVQLMYYLIGEQGYTTKKVADYLNAIGVPPSYTKDGRQIKRGKRKVNTAGIWRPGRIRNMIVNTTYKGIHHYGKRTNKDREIITREVPAIVSEELWSKAQQVLRNNQLEAMKNAKRQYLLRGLIKCGECGRTYHGTAFNGPGGKLKAYYVCGGKSAYIGPNETKCTSKNVPQEWIEKIVWQDCIDFLDNPGEAIKELASNIEKRKSQKDTLIKELETVKNAIKEKETEKQSILDLFRKRVIGSVDVERQLQIIAQEAEALEQRAGFLQKRIETEEELSKKFISAEELLARLKIKLSINPSSEVKREIVRTLVKEVNIHTKVGENGRLQALLTVQYTFSNDVTRTVRDSC